MSTPRPPATQPPAPEPLSAPPSTALPPTEQRNPASTHLDQLSAADVVALMNAEEYRVLRAVEQAAALLAVAAERVAESFLAEGRTVLVGAGTSGRIALQEVAELPPTFGVPADGFVVLAAGSTAMGPSAITQAEDDAEAAPRALAALGVSQNDTVIGIAASGTTPFVRAGIKAAASQGAWTCGLANNPGSPLLEEAGIGILLDTGPEVLTGSTRLKAGTAQKLALNRITTAAMVQAGRVVENHMVDLHGTGAKFRLRSVRIVRDLAGVNEERALTMLEEADWSVREALRASTDPGTTPSRSRPPSMRSTRPLRA
jgi:N-acetylmuramic acid 6-phosphate etherase